MTMTRWDFGMEAEIGPWGSGKLGALAWCGLILEDSTSLDRGLNDDDDYDSNLPGATFSCWS